MQGMCIQYTHEYVHTCSKSIAQQSVYHYLLVYSPYMEIYKTQSLHRIQYYWVQSQPHADNQSLVLFTT